MMGVCATFDGIVSSVELTECHGEGWVVPWSEAVGSWHLLHTKSRQEKILSEELIGLGVRHYLPLVNQVRFYGRRKTDVLLPLFTGYLFLKGTVEQTYVADRTRRVAKIISVRDQEQLERELLNIWLALDRHGSLDPFPFLVAGVKVEVKSGPFRGLQGIVEKRNGSAKRLILEVGILGRAVSLEIDGALLDPM